MKKRNNLTLVIAGIAVTVITFGAVSGMKNKDEDKTLNSLNYQIGALDDVTGKFDDEEKVGIVTRKYYKIEELKSIELDKDVVVYLNVYDEDKTLIQVDEFTEDVTEEVIAEYSAIGGVYFKLEVVDPEDDEISILDAYKLSEKVTVTLREVEDEDKKSED